MEIGDDGLTQEEREKEGKEYMDRAIARVMRYLAQS